MKILYVGPISGTSLHRLMALRRLGHEVSEFDFAPYAEAGNRLTVWLRWRTLMGTQIKQLNQELLAMVRPKGFDLVWCDKAQMLRPQTIRAINQHTPIVHYSSDLPSNLRGDPGWHLFRAAVPEYHAVILPSAGHRPLYEKLGARQILHMPFGYDPQSHYPPAPNWRDDQCKWDVSFIGTPYEKRAPFLLTLAREHNIQVNVFGNQWQRTLNRQERATLKLAPSRTGDAYRITIWQSRICLGFVTHTMAHTSARRWSEITACGGFLLAEHTPDAHTWFRPEEEASFFSSVDECAERIHTYLAKPDLRQRIAARGQQRIALDHANDHLLAEILQQLCPPA